MESKRRNKGNYLIEKMPELAKQWHPTKNKDISLYINAYDKNKIESYRLTLKEGKYPKNKNEIVVSEGLLKHLNKKIGDKVIFEVGDIEYTEGTDIPKLINPQKNTYKIVGILNKTPLSYNSQLFALAGFDINSVSNKEEFNSFCTIYSNWVNYSITFLN